MNIANMWQQQHFQKLDNNKIDMVHHKQGSNKIDMVCHKQGSNNIDMVHYITKTRVH